MLGAYSGVLGRKCADARRLSRRACWLAPRLTSRILPETCTERARFNARFLPRVVRARARVSRPSVFVFPRPFDDRWVSLCSRSRALFVATVALDPRALRRPLGGVRAVRRRDARRERAARRRGARGRVGRRRARARARRVRPRRHRGRRRSRASPDGRPGRRRAEARARGRGAAAGRRGRARALAPRSRRGRRAPRVWQALLDQLCRRPAPSRRRRDLFRSSSPRRRG